MPLNQSPSLNQAGSGGGCDQRQYQTDWRRRSLAYLWQRRNRLQASPRDDCSLPENEDLQALCSRVNDRVDQALVVAERLEYPGSQAALYRAIETALTKPSASLIAAGYKASSEDEGFAKMGQVITALRSIIKDLPAEPVRSLCRQQVGQCLGDVADQTSASTPLGDIPDSAPEHAQGSDAHPYRAELERLAEQTYPVWQQAMCLAAKQAAWEALGQTRGAYEIAGGISSALRGIFDKQPDCTIDHCFEVIRERCTRQQGVEVEDVEAVVNAFKSICGQSRV